MRVTVLFRDRWEAGRLLASYVREVDVGTNPLVMALPRGGAPVGFELANALGAPFDVLPVEKVGLPGHRQLVLGAVATDGARVLDHALLVEAGLAAAETGRLLEAAATRVEEREAFYRNGHPRTECLGRNVILVDDGLATGFSMRAAIAALRSRGALRVTGAVPVGTAERCASVSRELDLLICPDRPERFRATGWWYRDFKPVTDETVRELLARARGVPSSLPASHSSGSSASGGGSAPPISTGDMDRMCTQTSG